MVNSWKEIHTHNRETEALAERLELRLHAIAFVIAVIVLGMRLVTGRQDLESDGSPLADPSAESAEPTASPVLL